MGMDEKVDEVLKQYELDIKAKRRERGSEDVESGDEYFDVVSEICSHLIA